MMQPTQPAPSRSVLAWPAMIWLNLQVYTLAAVITLLFAIFGLGYIGLHRLVTRDDRRNRQLIRRTISWYGSFIIRCGWPLVTVRFVDHEPDAKPPLVFVANHPSSTDGFLMAFLPLEAVQVLNIWPAHLPGVGFMARIAEYLKPREMPFEEFLAAGSRLISQGVSVIAFPEGTRTGFRELGNFHGSAFRLAQHNGVPVVPLVIAGNEAIPPRGSIWMRPGKIVVTKLRAVMPEQYSGMSPYKLKTMVREQIHSELLKRNRVNENSMVAPL